MTKAEERSRIRARRSARTTDERRSAAELIAVRVLELVPQRPSLVTAYQSMASEPGTEPLISSILRAGHRLLLPRIDGRRLEWVPVTQTSTFAAGPMGILEPTGPSLVAEPSPLADADVLVIPGLAVDRTGRRLGQGGGYYDQALAVVPAFADGGPLRVAVLFDDEFLEQVPSEEHDCSVDVLVTPLRTAHFHGDDSGRRWSETDR